MIVWVVDASPLIFLAKLGHLALLRQMADVVYVPQAVLMEVRAQPDVAWAIIETSTQTWLEVRAVENRYAVELLLDFLDLGESEVITLAKSLRADRVILDDLDARRFARRTGLSIVGTLGILLAAKLQGELSAIHPEIERLQSFGFWAAPGLINAILQEAGER
jgi:hypothetical protein